MAKERRNSTSAPTRILPTVEALIPIVDVTEEDAFIDAKGNIVDLVQVTCKDMNASKEYDVEFDMYNMTWMYKSYNGDIKVIGMNYPVDTHQQLGYLENVMERTTNPVFLRELEEEKRLMLYAHAHFAEKEYYLMFFSADMTEHRRNMNRITAHLLRSGQVRTLRLGKKIQILSKMLNMNTALTAMPETKDIVRGIPEGKKYNPYLLGKIQPQGGVSLRDERLIRKGDGYEACIHVYGYPSQVRFNWLAEFSGFDNTITTIDIGSLDRVKTLENISKSIEEQRSRFMDARYETDKFDAQRVYQQLENLHEEIIGVGEVMKRIHIRIFTYAKNLKKMDEQIDKIIAEIESKGFRACIFLDEGMYEWKSLLLSITQQQALPNGRDGSSLPSETLALGHPFHFSSLSDPYGTYWGYTSTQGTVFFSPYQKDKQRLSYCSIVLGLMGSGKSTFLKEALKKDAITGNYIRGFATNDEFHRLIRYMGGSIINLDGSDGFLNVLHVYKTDALETASFIKHVEKVCQFYKLLVPDSDSYDLMTLQDVLRILYQNHMGYSLEGGTCITGHEPGEYPILSDLLQVIREEMYSDTSMKIRHQTLSNERYVRLERLELAISTLVQNMGSIFDGHSSIRDFQKEQIVFFNVAGLLKLSSNVFDAQLYSAISMLWDNLIAIGGPQKEQFDAGKLKLHNIQYFMLYMDEAHNFISAKKLACVSYMDQFVRESRKFFGGTIFATHKVTDFFPSNSSADGTDAMKNLFSLAQYKMLFKQSPDTLEVLRDVFANELPGRDLEALPKFNQGECLLNISGANTLRFHVEISDRELQLFSGGR